MYARVTTYDLGSEPAADAPDAFAAAIERIRGLQGLVDAYFLVEQDGTLALTITLWEDAATLASSRVPASRARSDAARAVGAEVTSTREYAVAARGGPPLAATHLLASDRAD